MKPEAGTRIEALLAELERSTGPHTWSRVEELVRGLVDLYGDALHRLIAHAEGAGARVAELRERLADDDLLSGLLLVHGLHPHSLDERVERALRRLHPLLRLHAGEAEWRGVGPDGVGRIRLAATDRAASLEPAIRAAVEAAAPELERVAVEVAPRHRLPVLREAP